MEIIFGLAGLALIALWVLSFIGLLFPAKFQNFKKSAPVTRKDVFLVLFLGSFILILTMAFTAPTSSNNNIEVPSDGTDNTLSLKDANQDDSKPKYEIVSDDKSRVVTRKVLVELPSRTSSQKLTEIANEIKNDDKQNYKRTFIMYRIKGENSVAAWATTHFDPDLSVKFIGLSSDDFNKLLALKLDIDGEVIGQWVSPNGVSDHIDVIYKNGKRYFKREFYIDGAGKPAELKHDGNTYRYADPNETQFYKIDSSGDLEYHGSSGNVFLAKKLDSY